MRNGATMPPFAVWCLALVAVLLPKASGDAREAHHRPQMRREPLQHSMAPEPGEAELNSGTGHSDQRHWPHRLVSPVPQSPRSASVGSLGDIFVQDEDDDSVCKSLCHAVDITSISKKCSDLSNEECASSAFYETMDDGSRRPCSLQAAGVSLSDPEAQNCGVDSKQICRKGSPLCQEDAPSSHGPLEEICNICSGGGEFLPEATAFMEDGKPFSCQFALDQIRAGGSRLTCQEAAEEYADCCARSGNDGKPGPSDRTDNWSCELCAGFGDLNSTAVAMVIEGSPMTCSEAQDNLRSGRAPISCEVARDSSLVARCCSQRVDDDAAVGLQNCSICGAGETFDAESIAYTSDGEMLTCEDAYSRLQDASVKTSCEDARGKLQGRCCKCYLCSEGQSLIPDAAAEHIEGGEPMACQEAQLLLKGNASKPPCTEAKRKWSEYCCGEAAADAAMVRAAAEAAASQPAAPRPEQQPSGAAAAATTSAGVQGPSSFRSTTEDTEAEEHGEEATPFCRSLCLKTDTKDWNMTCSELPEEECASTHFFETVGACERRLCVWAAPWKCTVDYTQACISCNWPCGRKASTSTTSTTTTTTLTTTTMTSSTTITVTETTTTTSTSTSTVTTTSTSTTTTTTTSTTTTSTTTVTGSTTDRYHLAVATPYLTKSGVVVPTRCFEFCDRTNVRSMYVSCHQLSPEMCQSESFYETDLKGNRRHCILIGESCTVDKSFVCNASMPICQVSDGSVSEASPESAAVANGTGPPSANLSRSPDAGISSTLPVEMPRITNGSDLISGEHGDHETTSARQDRFDESSQNTKAFARQDPSGESVDSAKALPRKDQLLPHAVMQSVVAAAQECLAVGLNVLDIYEVVNATVLHVPTPIKSPAEMSLREAVEVALLAGVSSSHILQDLQHAGIGTEEPASLPPLPPLPPPSSGRVETVEINPHGPDRIVFRAPYTEVTTTTSSQLSHTSLQSDVRCSSLCSKQEVNDCGSIEPELCTSEEFYSTSQEQTSLCQLVEDTCQSGPSFTCESHADCAGHNRGRLGVDTDTVDRFCKSLCFKHRVSTGNCSTLQEYDCKSRMYYMDAVGGKVLCQWEAAGYCHVDMSARCPKKQLCPGTTTSSPVVPPFCYTLCGKTDVGSHVSACEELPEAQCKTWQYYATIDGHRALCSWSEIGVCSLDTSASCPPLMPLCPSSTTATALLPFADYGSPAKAVG